ncbi:hypothetical protein [Paeniglutamicibacter sp. NPDC091659]|uniref:hypothetical protein n=1 Tax=Paeniglutamicibacter sp. NPDC091659 TaxID=3364389 RepID=UPI0037FDBB1E
MADEQGPPHDFDNLAREFVERLDAFDLVVQQVDEAEISTGDPDDGRNGRRVGESAAPCFAVASKCSIETTARYSGVGWRYSWEKPMRH